MGNTRRRGHYVEAVPEAVNEIDIGVPGLAKHDLCTCSAAASGVCGEIFRPHVGLRLDDAPDAECASIVVHEMHTDEITGNSQRARGVEAARKFAGSSHRPA